MKWIYGIGAAVLLAACLLAANATGEQIGLANAAAGNPENGLTSLILFMDAATLPKLAMILCALMLMGGAPLAMVGLILALTRQAGGARVFEIMLGAGGAAMALLGAAAGLYSETLNLQAAAATHTTDLGILAPSRAESFMSVSVGAFTGFVLLAAALIICLVRLARTPRPTA
ncbi:MAG: hypothetical protein V4466_15175 [Pseudomonadota bacterium]